MGKRRGVSRSQKPISITTQKAIDMPAQKSALLESSVVKGILKYLNSLEGCRAIKTSGDAKRAGEPDIDCVYYGQAIKLEVKRPGNNRVTKLQQATLQKWADAGAIVGVVHSVDEVKELLKELK